jgi:anti-sigma-K factor RskA
MSHPRDLLNDYVLGTLTPAEMADVKAYLATSEQARAEERALRESLVAVTDALHEVPAPKSAWAKIQAGLEQEKSIEPSSKVIRDELRKRSFWWTSERAAWLTAASLAFLAFGVSWWGLNSYRNYQRANFDKALIATYLSSQDVQRISLQAEDFSDLGSVLISGDEALFVLANSPVRGQAYQAWGHTNANWEPGSTEQLTSLEVSNDNIFEVGTAQFAALYLSLEPAGGSPQPTQPLTRVSLRNPVATSPLEITQPVNGMTVNSSSVIVSGIVDNTVTSLSYSVNGNETVETTFANNRFAFTLQLADGENVIVIEAQRRSGEFARATINIVKE